MSNGIASRRCKQVPTRRSDNITLQSRPSGFQQARQGNLSRQIAIPGERQPLLVSAPQVTAVKSGKPFREPGKSKPPRAKARGGKHHDQKPCADTGGTTQGRVPEVHYFTRYSSGSSMTLSCSGVTDRWQSMQKAMFSEPAPFVVPNTAPFGITMV